MRLPSLSTRPVPSPVPRQISMPFESAKLRGMNPVERGIVVAQLAELLMGAAGVGMEESGREER